MKINGIKVIAILVVLPLCNIAHCLEQRSSQRLLQKSLAKLNLNQQTQLKNFLNLDEKEKEYIFSMLRSAEGSTENQQIQNQWGFLKNIVNIDTFFSSGALSGSSSSDDKPSKSSSKDADKVADKDADIVPKIESEDEV